MKHSGQIALVLLILSACSPYNDMQGLNPKDYYADHPVKNTVETRIKSYTVRFASNSDRLTADSIDELDEALAEASPQATKTVTVYIARAQLANSARQQHLTKLLRSMGYQKKQIRFEPAAEISGKEARIEATYTAVVSPHCPDWRVSPVTNYSNTAHQANFGCATTVNLGLMVADPQDLVKGKGESANDSDAVTSGAAVNAYKNSSGSSSGSAATGSAASADSGTSAVDTAQ